MLGLRSAELTHSAQLECGTLRPGHGGNGTLMQYVRERKMVQLLWNSLEVL